MVETKFHDIMVNLNKMDKLEYLFHLKICDESTLDGQLGLTADQAQSVMECEKLDDDKVPGHLYILKIIDSFYSVI